MLVFAALTPHPLISIPEIGKTAISKVRQTRAAFQALALELYAAKPDTILIISPHGAHITEAYTINQRPQLAVDFTSFGDLVDHQTFTNNVGLGYKIKEANETTFPIILTDETVLDYGFAVPLLHLTRAVKYNALTIVPIGHSTLDLQSHFNFGIAINRAINLSPNRIAVIASGDLAHGAVRSSVAPYVPAARDFNTMIRETIEKNDTKKILSLSNSEMNTLSACITRPLTILFGILGERKYKATIVSSETALGASYLIARFTLA